jgi:CTP-dependent riboflavin kinase
MPAPKHTKLKGIVVSGLGTFSYRIDSIPGLLAEYSEKTGMRFYPGTLNIELLSKFSSPKGGSRTEMGDFSGTVSANLLPCKINGIMAFILRTSKGEQKKGSKKTVIEIASDVGLRNRLGIKDGDVVEIQV